ncbi:MAG: repressor LexA, partial [Clostridia bacterium]|nr:repressor LexA [Clostridia bacterium]
RTTVLFRKLWRLIRMRTKDKEMLQSIKHFVNDYCDANGRGPSISEVAKFCGMSKSNTQLYLIALREEGRIAQCEHGYESLLLAEQRKTQNVPIVGAIPCGPLEEMEECIEGYVRLPESFIGRGKFYLLKASGNSMIGAGINDGDLVLIRQQNTANIGEIIVALVDNEVTLKRLAYDNEEQRHYLHPENKRMKDIYPERIEIQGVAVKVIKDL